MNYYEKERKISKCDLIPGTNGSYSEIYKPIRYRCNN